MIFSVLDGLEELEVGFLVEQVFQRVGVVDLHLHQPAILFSRNRNVLGLILKARVHLNDLAIARHVDIGSSLDTFDRTLTLLTW